MTIHEIRTAAPSGRKNPRYRARRRTKAQRSRLFSTLLLAAPGSALLMVMSLTPIVVLLQMSVSQVNISNIVGSWRFIGLKNFTEVLSTTGFAGVATQTFLFVIFVLLATLGAGFIVALLLRSSRSYSVITQTILILVWTLPPVIVGALWKFLLSTDGFINGILSTLKLTEKPISFLSQPSTALAAIGAVTVWVGIPFAGLVLKSAILDVPEDILNAARVDGATSLQIFTRIVLPIIRPTILILAVLIVVGAFKAFDLIYTMTRGGPGTSSATLPFLGYTTAFQDYKFGNAAAISVFAMAIVLLLAVAYIFAVRREEK